MDQLCHNCLYEGATNATQNIHRVKHLDNGAMEKKIKEVREKLPDEMILVVTEGLFSMDSDYCNLIELQ